VEFRVLPTWLPCDLVKDDSLSENHRPLIARPDAGPKGRAWIQGKPRKVREHRRAGVPLV
jgi:hypothetical protein